MITVLIIEENIRLVDTLYQMLEAPNVDVTMFGTFAFVRTTRFLNHIQQLRHRPAHVILLDLTLADGQEAVRLQALQAKVPDLPIIVMLCQENQTFEAEAARLGVVDCLIGDQITPLLLARALFWAHHRHKNNQTQKPVTATKIEQQTLISLAKASPDVIVILDVINNQIVYLSQPTFLGYTLENMTLRELVSLVHPDDFKAVRRQLRELLSGQSMANDLIEFRVKNHTKELEWLQSQYAILERRTDGQPVRVLLTMTNITSRREAAEAVYRYAERLKIFSEIDRAILSTRYPQEIAQIALRYIRQLIPSKQAIVTAVSPHNKQMELLSIDSEEPEEIAKDVGRSYTILSNMLVPLHTLRDGRPKLIPDIPKADKRTYILRPLETAKIRSILIVPLLVKEELLGTLNLTGEQTHMFTKEHVDIAQQIANSVAIAMQNARLDELATARANELEALTQISTILRLAKNTDEILSLTLEKVNEMVGGISGSIFLVEPETNDLVARSAYPSDPNMEARRRHWGQGITGRVAATGQLFMAEDLMQDTMAHTVLREVDQLQLVRSCIALPLRTQDRVVGVMHVGLPERHTYTDEEIRLLTAVAEIAGTALERSLVMDTLEQRVLERTRALEEANEQLKELDRLKSKFVSDVSHELRTPITNLNIYLDLLKTGPKHKREYYLDVLSKQGGRLLRAAEAILDLSRVTMRQDTVAFAPVDLNTLVTQVVEAHELVAEAANLQLVIELQENLPIVYGERNQLSQVITNLLNNAINYTPSGKIVVRTLTVFTEKYRVCLEVSDTGMGIENQDLEYLFDRFYRGDRASRSNIPGTGLGLAIVKDIVELHNGTVTVQSTVGVGTLFQVWL